MKRKSLFSVATSGLVLAAAFIPMFAQAGDGVVKFTGSITDVSCNINGSEPGIDVVTNVVDLGRISPSVFDNGPNKTSPQVPFQLVLSGDKCADKAKVAISFDQTANVDKTTGNLMLTGGNLAAKGIQIQIFNNHDASSLKIPLGQDEASPQIAEITGKTATLKYKAAYVSTAAAVGPGAGDSHIRYTLSYQ